MNIKMTRHARIRSKQRGIPEEALSVILEYGICEKVAGDATRYYLDKRALDQRIHELKHEIQRVERLKNVRLIEANDDGSIITVCRDAA
jgi:hypothetical protein